LRGGGGSGHQSEKKKVAPRSRGGTYVEENKKKTVETPNANGTGGSPFTKKIWGKA